MEQQAQLRDGTFITYLILLFSFQSLSHSWHVKGHICLLFPMPPVDAVFCASHRAGNFLLSIWSSYIVSSILSRNAIKYNSLCHLTFGHQYTLNLLLKVLDIFILRQNLSLFSIFSPIFGHSWVGMETVTPAHSSSVPLILLWHFTWPHHLILKNLKISNRV